MTTLAANVAIGDNHLVVDTAFADGSFPGYVKIDDELLTVGGVDWRDSTLLSLSKPAAAAHDNGATVTYAGTPYDSDFLTATGGGGTQRLRLLGPFHVAFNDAGLAEPAEYGIPTLEIPAGVLMRILFIVTAEWNPGVVQCVLVPSDDLEASAFGLGTFTLDNIVPAAFARPTAIGGDISGTLANYAGSVPTWAYTIEACTVLTGAFAGTPPFTQGEGDIYALIAEPV